MPHETPRIQKTRRRGAEEKWRQASKVNSEEEGHNPEITAGTDNPGVGRRSSAVPTGERGAPRGRQPGDKRNLPSFPSTGGTQKSENAKKRKFNWHSKCPKAAGVELMSPEDGRLCGSEEEDLVFWITVKIGDQVYTAVLDTGAPLSIVPRSLPKQRKIQKTQTMAIRVRDGRTTHSLGGGDVIVCLGDEEVTQHCKVLDTNAFDIVIGTDLLRRNLQVNSLSLQRP